MMLRQHAMATLAIVFPFVFPSQGWILAVFFAVLGAMLPDMDISDCNPVSGRKNAVSRVLSFLGLVFNWPLSRVFSFISGKDVSGHRGFAHTVIAGALLSALVGALLFIANLNHWYAIWLFAGYMLHLFEDAMTPSGVAPLFPSSKRFYGKIKTENAAWDIIAVLLCVPAAMLAIGALNADAARAAVALSALALSSTIRTRG
jgi:membrane-bound metal-dependent hydrolase YbcI (DUF457 family)